MSEEEANQIKAALLQLSQQLLKLEVAITKLGQQIDKLCKEFGHV